MGLDMYLYANSRKLCEDMHSEDGQSWEVQEGIAIRWRKANAIHNWFVRNIFGGDNRNCAIADVSVEELKKLRDDCIEVVTSSALVDGLVFSGITVDEDGNTCIEREPGLVIQDPSKANEIMPTMGGFFYGSTEYDEWYWRCLAETAKKIDRILDMVAPNDECQWILEHKEEPGWALKFYYQADW